MADRVDHIIVDEKDNGDGAGAQTRHGKAGKADDNAFQEKCDFVHLMILLFF